MKRVTLSALLSAFAALPAAAAVDSTFDDLTLGADGFFFPAVATTFASGAATFKHNYSDFGIPGCCWNGWTYSNRTDTTTPGFTNQYSAFTGGGFGGSANYGVSYEGFAEPPTISFGVPGTVAGGYFTNTTYAALSMLNGDSFAKKFGGPSGNDPDFFKLTITGFAGTQQTGSVDFYLADYRFDDNAQDFVLSSWRFVDLAGLGVVSKLQFKLDSSDKGSFGINTPAYFAMDNLAVTPIPEPGTWAMLLAGLGALGALGRRGTLSRRHAR